MSELLKRQRKFIEFLVTIGSLLAVFLAIATQSTVINIVTNSTSTTHVTTQLIVASPLLIYWGVIFAISALLVYSKLLFPEVPIRMRTRGRLPFFILVAIMAGSLAALVGMGLAYGLTGSADGNFPLAILITSVVVVLVLLLYYRIIQVLRVEQKEAPSEIRTESEKAKVSKEDDDGPKVISVGMPSTADSMITLAFLLEQRRWVRARYEEARLEIQSSADLYRSIRAVLIVLATFLIPLVLGLAPLNLLTTSTAVNIALVVGGVAGSGSLAGTIGELIHRARLSRLKKQYSPLGYAMDVYVNAYTSEQAAQGGENKAIASEFYAAATIVFTAVIYQFLQKGAKYLDDSTKDLMNKQVDYMCDQRITWWDSLDKVRIRTVLETNAALASAVSSYQEYCESKGPSRGRET